MCLLRGDIGGMESVRELYSEYAFIDTNGTAEVKPVAGKAEDEAIPQVAHIMKPLIERTYEGLAWYFVVYKPYNKPYGLDPDWFAVKGLNSVRRKLTHAKVAILTRETDSAKIHVNALICTSHPMMKLHGKTHCNKYKMTVLELTTLGDRLRVLSYITKENKNRPFVKYLDYIIVDR